MQFYSESNSENDFLVTKTMQPQSLKNILQDKIYINKINNIDHIVSKIQIVVYYYLGERNICALP